MPQTVTNGASMTCTFGTTPSTLTVMPVGRVNAVNNPVAVITDNAPMVNIKPFGMCTTLSNPQVAAATSAAQGVLTPQPCIPVIPAPWTPGSPTVMIGNKPVVNNTCTATCAWGGLITFTNAGQVTVNNP